MFVVCNGAPKGGSTWQYLLIPYVFPDVKTIPSTFQDNQFRNSSLELSSVPNFLDSANISEEFYYSKNHWKYQPELDRLLGDKDVRLLGIVRDIRDVLVSRYFHDVRNSVIPDGSQFYDYYKVRGHSAINHYCTFQKSWCSSDLIGNKHLFMMSYEALISNFDAEFSRLYTFLTGKVPSLENITRARTGTNIKELQKSNPAFFRSGISGDWVNHLDRKTAVELHSQLSENGYLQLLAELKSRNLVVKDDLFSPEWVKILN
ncbi:sulfotransferase domain-containing protein [Synechococcus sp. A10-1-5-1]|uniref:sulfotransferase domain-containing protein n=1 Tax=Synechococcus sp. A10-1-5-1 TaxID=2936507 RepID=UPI002000B6CF|nr:sulfotransferase domain-containing protein [Synechococcus sp. A10-1-5-1]UPM49178.1 sulfotransferase domain-containing protein [Synechococcus sp. A10-1-5-1]